MKTSYTAGETSVQPCKENGTDLSDLGVFLPARWETWHNLPVVAEQISGEIRKEWP